jgi:hypothetical protein
LNVLHRESFAAVVRANPTDEDTGTVETAEGAGLENRYTACGIQGSNPCLSAKRWHEYGELQN